MTRWEKLKDNASFQRLVGAAYYLYHYGIRLLALVLGITIIVTLSYYTGFVIIRLTEMEIIGSPTGIKIVATFMGLIFLTIVAMTLALLSLGYKKAKIDFLKRGQEILKPRD